MKNFFLIFINFINKHTTGIPFLIWIGFGLIISVYLYIFRDRYHDFSNILYILAISAIWVIGSDILKKKAIFNSRPHFILDSFFYIGTYSAIFYYTGVMEGGLSFIFLLLAISAPIFGTLKETFFLLVVSVVMMFYVNHLFYRLNGKEQELYNIGLIILLFFFQLAISGVIKFYHLSYQKELANFKKIDEALTESNKEISKELDEKNKLEKTLRERSLQLEEMKDGLKKTVESQTKGLQEKLEEIKKVNDIIVGRELKMVELKEEIVKLKNELKNKESNNEKL